MSRNKPRHQGSALQIDKLRVCGPDAHDLIQTADSNDNAITHRQRLNDLVARINSQDGAAEENHIVARVRPYKPQNTQ